MVRGFFYTGLKKLSNKIAKTTSHIEKRRKINLQKKKIHCKKMILFEREDVCFSWFILNDYEKNAAHTG